MVWREGRPWAPLLVAAVLSVVGWAAELPEPHPAPPAAPTPHRTADAAPRSIADLKAKLTTVLSLDDTAEDEDGVPVVPADMRPHRVIVGRSTGGALVTRAAVVALPEGRSRVHIAAGSSGATGLTLHPAPEGDDAFKAALAAVDAASGDAAGCTIGQAAVNEVAARPGDAVRRQRVALIARARAAEEDAAVATDRRAVLEQQRALRDGYVRDLLRHIAANATLPRAADRALAEHRAAIILVAAESRNATAAAAAASARAVRLQAAADRLAQRRRALVVDVLCERSGRYAMVQRVSCLRAGWRPAYDLQLRSTAAAKAAAPLSQPVAEKAELRSSAAVWQQCGEPWARVDVRLALRGGYEELPHRAPYPGLAGRWTMFPPPPPPPYDWGPLLSWALILAVGLAAIGVELRTHCGQRLVRAAGHAVADSIARVGQAATHSEEDVAAKGLHTRGCTPTTKMVWLVVGGVVMLFFFASVETPYDARAPRMHHASGRWGHPPLEDEAAAEGSVRGGKMSMMRMRKAAATERFQAAAMSTPDVAGAVIVVPGRQSVAEGEDGARLLLSRAVVEARMERTATFGWSSTAAQVGSPAELVSRRHLAHYARPGVYRRLFLTGLQRAAAPSGPGVSHPVLAGPVVVLGPDGRPLLWGESQGQQGQSSAEAAALPMPTPAGAAVVELGPEPGLTVGAAQCTDDEARGGGKLPDALLPPSPPDERPWYRRNGMLPGDLWSPRAQLDPKMPGDAPPARALLCSVLTVSGDAAARVGAEDTVVALQALVPVPHPDAQHRGVRTTLAQAAERGIVRRDIGGTPGADEWLVSVPPGGAEGRLVVRAVVSGPSGLVV